MAQNLPPLAFIHIGKTGGTFLKQVISLNQGSKANFILPGHKSLAELEALYGKDLKFFFLFRDPTARFVSGFYSRLRMGRPRRNVKWSTPEAVAFGFFPDANALAESLSSPDDRLKSAAIYAMGAIRHIHRGYAFHFGRQLDFTLDAMDRLLVCADLQNINEYLAAFMDHIGLKGSERPPEDHTVPKYTYNATLSPQARKNLREFWQEEYDYYDMFKELERGFFGS